METLLLLSGVLVSWAITYALSVRVTRMLQRSGWFRTRTTVQVINVPMFFAMAGLAYAVALPMGLTEGGWADVLLFDLLLVISAGLVGAARSRWPGGCRRPGGSVRRQS